MTDSRNSAAGGAPAPAYTAYRVDEAIRVDGRLAERCWTLAPRSPRFVDLVTGEPAFLDTRAAVLWSEEFLYVGYWIEEPAVRASYTERDCMVCDENDVELFVAGKDSYYELEINARNTILEIFYIWQDAYTPESAFARSGEFDLLRRSVDLLGGMCDEQRVGSNPRGRRWAFRDWDFPGLQTATWVDGNVDDPSTIDRGWTVEIALPWAGMKWLADGRPLPPRDGDVWHFDFSRFEHIRANGRAFQPPIGWAWSSHGAYNSHMPERFTPIRFSTLRVEEAAPR